MIRNYKNTKTVEKSVEVATLSTVTTTTPTIITRTSPMSSKRILKDNENLQFSSKKQKIQNNNIQKYLVVKKINSNEHLLIPVQTLPAPQQNIKLQNDSEKKKIADALVSENIDLQYLSTLSNKLVEKKQIYSFLKEKKKKIEKKKKKTNVQKENEN